MNDYDWDGIREALEENLGEWVLAIEAAPNKGPAQRARAGEIAKLDGLYVETAVRRNQEVAGVAWDIWMLAS